MLAIHIASTFAADNLVHAANTQVCRSSENLQDLPEQRVSHVVYRFNPLDPRCGINLDEIDPSQWKLLENATDDYIEASKDRFQELADLLLSEAPEPGVFSLYNRHLHFWSNQVPATQHTLCTQGC